ncbi:hypothetical protein [Prevotella sp.]|uniref:hypothetical protein n=1 Tax=Prevotella sp. TaxID=59823 RepID=UPI003AB6C874
MEVDIFKKAYCLAESLDTCDNAKYVLDYGGSKDSVDKFVSILAKNDKEFKNKLRGLIAETRKRLQKEFDEL